MRELLAKVSDAGRGFMIQMPMEGDWSFTTGVAKIANLCGGNRLMSV